MYLAVDVGGTKTLLAVFDKDGTIITQYKFPTPQDYEEFKVELKKAVTTELSDHKPEHACVAIPGRFSEDKETVLNYGNLKWPANLSVRSELENLLGIPAIVENDAKLAGLSEAILVHDRYNKVQYVTVSTGIGGAVIINGIIDPDLSTNEPGQVMLEHDGRPQKWEDFASGRAIVAQYGKRASEIEDETIWREISYKIAIGLITIAANIMPDVFIIGGGVGSHFEKFGTFLNEELAKLSNDMVPAPPVLGAQRAEEAVIYGCYELIKQKLA